MARSVAPSPPGAFRLAARGAAHARSLPTRIRRLGERIGRLVAGIAGIALALVAGAPLAHAAAFRDGDVYARVSATRVVLGNDLVERRWTRAHLRTVAVVDKRAGGKRWSRGTPDFTLKVGGAAIPSGAFSVGPVAVTRLERGGLRVTMTSSGPPGLQAIRTAEAYPGVAGFRTQTVLIPTAGLALSGATLEQAAT